MTKRCAPWPISVAGRRRSTGRSGVACSHSEHRKNLNPVPTFARFGEPIPQGPFRTRLMAGVLAAFTVVAALVFHRALGDPNQFVHFLKNLVIAGGLLHITAVGPQTVHDTCQQRSAKLKRFVVLLAARTDELE